MPARRTGELRRCFATASSDGDFDFRGNAAWSNRPLSLLFKKWAACSLLPDLPLCRACVCLQTAAHLGQAPRGTGPRRMIATIYSRTSCIAFFGFVVAASIFNCEQTLAEGSAAEAATPVVAPLLRDVPSDLQEESA